MPREITILFEPEKHEYTVNGRKADISVTALIQKQIDKTDWGSIPEDVLKRASDRGTAVHLDLELFIKDNKPPEAQETKNFQAWLATQSLVNPRTEFKLAIEHRGLLLTGTADLMGMLNNESFIADYKTTSVIHTETVRWQMSLLDYMARKCNGSLINGEVFTYVPAQKMYVFHFDKQAKFTPVEVTPISDVEIERLLDAESAEEEYHPTTFITPRIQSDVLAIQARIVEHEKALKQLKAQEELLKSSLLAAFEAHPDIKKVGCPEFTITYVAPSTSRVFDAKLFQEQNPELAEQYKKESARKGYVKITLHDELLSTSSSELPALPKAQKREKAKRGYF